MFAHEDPPTPIESRTALRAALGLAEPLSPTHINRSLAQRRRFARERAQKAIA